MNGPGISADGLENNIDHIFYDFGTKSTNNIVFSQASLVYLSGSLIINIYFFLLRLL